MVNSKNLTKFTLVFLTTFLSITVFARNPLAPDFSLRTKVESNELKVIATPPPGHHFNKKAPMYLECKSPTKKRFQPKVAGETEVLFEIPCPSSPEFQVTLYLCDDKQSFCEDHKVTGTWDMEHFLGKLPKEEPKAPAKKTQRSDNKLKYNKNGFILNDAVLALQIAKKEKKPLLIDFYGIWCPPCNELEEKVFATQAFRKKTACFVKLQLDADMESSWDLKDRYHVGGYPTVIFASEDGDEIDRIVGFRRLNEFLSVTEDAFNNKALPLAKLKETAEQGDKTAAKKVGKILIERKDFKAALTYLSKLEGKSEDLFRAQVGLLEIEKGNSEKEAQAKLIEVLKEAISTYATSPVSIEFLSKLADVYEDQKNTQHQKEANIKLIRLAEELLKKPESLKGFDITVTDLETTVASTYEEIGDKAKAKEAWKKAAVSYRKKLKNGDERSSNLELAYCLYKSNDFEGANSIYERFQKKYPKEFTFYYGQANMLFNTGKLELAQAVAEKALKYSYGDNRLRAAALLGNILASLGKSKEALELINGTLTAIPTPPQKEIRTHRYLKALQDLRKKFEKG